MTDMNTFSTFIPRGYCRRRGWVLSLLLLCAFVATSTAEDLGKPEDFRLVPFPKRLELGPGRFALNQPLIFEVGENQLRVLGKLLNEELSRAGLPEARTSTMTSGTPAFRLAAESSATLYPSLPSESAPETYALEVRTNEIVCVARSTGGLVYGLQTLCQLLRANRLGPALPCLRIRDWPSLRWRAFQDDLTRGPSSTLDTLKYEAALGSYLKLNLLTYYMEYQYAFRKHPKIGPANGSLLPEELSALVAHAQPLHVEVLGNQQSFGHFGQILRHPEYAPLWETPDVLTPVREETYQLLDDLYSEVCPELPFPWFNVCCDETEGLGTGPARELAAKIGVGGVYVRHIRRVHDLLRDKHKKRMMMWEDIILQHPGNLQDIPKDTIMLTWGYDARASFEDQISPFATSGYEFFVCPGVSDWSRILPDFGVAITNIRHFVRDGIKHGALGMINTDWEDDGEALKAVKWYADAWAAECAWNASATPPAVFNRRVGAVLFGETGNHFGTAIDLLAQTHRLPAMNGMLNGRFWEKDFVPKASPAAVQAVASNLLAVVRPALRHLEACRTEAKCNQHLLEVLLFGAHRMALIGQRMLDGLEAQRLYEQAWGPPNDLNLLLEVQQLIRTNRDAHEKMGRRFSDLWFSESRPYALDWTLARYTNSVKAFDTLLGDVEAARLAALAGKPLPAPEKIGLANPPPRFHRIKPQPVFTAPLAPEMPWIEASASQRVGLTIGAGKVDRFDLPAEVELPVPPDVAGKPARAFIVTSNEPARELLAQLDRFEKSDKARLLLLLTGPLQKGAEVSVHVYLGCRGPSGRPTGAVTTRPATNGMHWLENDRVRLLLAPEGAHVYRWEVRSAANRDLTMPGETDWAGFSDINPLRNTQYELKCKACGPALVEYECSDSAGHTKTVRLYGGASWMEVFLNEPTSVYWDFDNPTNFAADGPTPGKWLFSDARAGLVGREAEGVPAQVKAAHTYWGVKYNPEGLALGLITPEVGALHVLAPGAGAGGVGIEGSPAADHFVTFAGKLEAPPAETMDRLQATLDLKRPPEVRLYSVQSR